MMGRQRPTLDARGLEAWCRSNTPRVRGARASLTRTHLAALTHLVEIVDSGATSTVSDATLVGNDAASATNTSLQAKQNLPTDGSPPNQSNPFVEAFANAPAAGATTLLDMARISTGFDPLNPALDENVAAYVRYINQVLANPMFHLELADKRSLQIREQDFNKLIRDIADLFDGIQAEDESKIKDSLTKLAEAATSYKDTRQSTDLFIQNAMQVDDGDVQIYIYYSTVTMVVHDGKSTTKQTDYTVNRTRLKFQKEFWNDITAAAVAQHHFKDLSDWLVGNSTRRGDDPQTLCLSR